MSEKIHKHLWYYITFLAIELSGVAGVYYFAHDRYLQMVIIFFMVLFYIIWSSIHHVIHHNLTIKIVLEHVLIGALGGAIVFFLLFAN